MNLAQCNRAAAIAALLILPLASAATQTQLPGTEPQLARQIHQAIALAQHGDEAQALSIANDLVAQHPNSAPALKLQGELLEDTGHADDAASSYERALTLSPNDPELLLKVGIARLVTGHYDQAISLLRHHLTLVPHDHDALFYLAQAYHLNGDNDLALKTIAESVRLGPGNASALQKYGELLCSSGNNQEGLRWLLKAQHIDPTLQRIDFDLAIATFNGMDLPSALKYAQKAAALQPGDPNILALLGSTDIKLSRWQDAKAAFLRVLTAEPDDAPSLLGLGQSQLELRQYQDAIDTLHRLLRIDPTQITAHFYLSRAYAGLGNTTEAEHQAALHHLMMQQMSFVRTLETDQRENAITAQARQLLTDHREAEALRLYQEHFKGTPATIADSYVFIGKLELFMGNTDDGLRNLHHALQLDSAVRGAHTYMGILALKNADLATAERDFTAELANDPNYQMAIAEMGEVRYRQQRWAEAAQLLAKSRTMTPELLYMLTDSYFHTGDIADANLTAETAVAYGRKNAQLMQGLLDLLNRNGQSALAQRLAADLNP